MAAGTPFSTRDPSMTGRGRMTEVQAAQLVQQGIALQRAGRLQEAERCYQRVLGERPEHPDALNLMGTIAIEAGAHDAAIGFLARAAKAQPKNSFFRNNLGYALLLNSEPEKALVQLRMALAANPRMLDALLNAAFAHRVLGEGEAACGYYRKATGFYPDHLPARVGLAEALIELGQNAEATELLRRVVRKQPGNVDALLALARGHRFAAGDPEAGLIETLADQGSLPARSRSAICWAAGKMYADTGRYDAAFASFQRSKTLAGGQFSKADWRAFVDKSIALFTPRFFAARSGLGDPSDRPVFIVGMPRSGTTLAEQILASHPDATAGGELPELEKSARLLTGRVEMHTDAFFSRLEVVDKQAARTEAARYLAVLARVSPTARRVTDKMPHNFQLLGLIALLFPNARVIHCRRSALDTCVSCYTHRFTAAHAYTHDLNALGFYYREYARLMAHWADVLPIPMLEFRYEDLIADQEGETRRLLAFAGLDWNEACLDFHKTKGSVRTPSQQQVRQPLYSSAIGQWRRYEKHLGPLRAALGDLAET